MDSAKFVFLGTGTSERVPRVTCLSEDPPTCAVCIDAQRPGSKNRRRNTSLLVQVDRNDGKTRNVVIDAGKSFYESSIEWFPQFGVTNLDAVVLTHAHADAAGGLDDLRDWTMNTRSSMPLYVRSKDMEVLSQTHFYLVNTSARQSGGSVANLEIIEIDDEPFDVLRIRFIPLPVEHGEGFTTNGYRIGNVCYVPDASKVPESTEKRMDGCEVLILDALRPGRTFGTHLTLEQAVDAARKLRPQKTLLTDMAHEIEYEATNGQLAELRVSEGLDIQLAYDGLAFEAEV